jgi:hypothetical protein
LSVDDIEIEETLGNDAMLLEISTVVIDSFVHGRESRLLLLAVRLLQPDVFVYGIASVTTDRAT